ncbi:MAG: 3-methyl-2-oxobutanoate hydroxymethyltransferase [Acidobacteriaceae bacterium]
MSLTTFSPLGGQNAANSTNQNASTKITVLTLQEKKSQGIPITCLTAYDYATARLVDEAGLDVILVGDSLAMVMQGYESTLPITMDEMLLYTRGVRRAVHHALLVADMPYGSYQTSVQEGVANAIRFVKEAGAEAVKLEGGRSRVEVIERIVDAEIPVMGHIGLTPQSLHRMGGYKVQGKTLPALEQLMKDALALERAGCFSIVLEGVPREVAQMITAELRIPTIGIGAGPDCDGQVLVIHDLLNLTFSAPAKFVRRYADAAELIRNAVTEYKHDVETRAFPAEAESYHLPRETQSALESLQLPRRRKA